MRKLWTALAAALMLLGGCTSAEVSESGNTGGQAESYLLKQAHTAFAADIAIVVDELWYQTGGEAPFRTKPLTPDINADTWSDDKTIRIRWRGGAYDCSHVIKFGNLGYDPEESQLTLGKTKVLSQDQDDLPKHARLFDLTESEEPGHFSETDTVTLAQSRSVEVTHGVEMDVTQSNTLQIGGSYAGVGIEDTISTAFEYKETDEYKQAEAESKDTSESVTFDVALPGGKATLILPTASVVNSSTPYMFQGSPTFSHEHTFGPPCRLQAASGQDRQRWFAQGGGYLDSPHNTKWTGGTSGGAVKFSGLDDWSSFLNGTNAAWPGMAGSGAGWRAASCKGACYEAYTRTTWRFSHPLVVAGTQHRTYQDAVKTEVSQVPKADIDSVASKYDIEVEGRP